MSWPDRAVAVSSGGRRVVEPERVVTPLRPVATLDVVEARHAEFLARIDERLDEAASELAETWQLDPTPGTPGLDGVDAPDILRERDLPEMMRALASGGGKRIRPSMCFWGWLAAGGQAGSPSDGHSVQVAAALELLHVFALIHDDVMDESASRRGRPSVHALSTQLHLHSRARGDAQRFGESIAVLVGDLAHAEADHLAAELPAPMRRLWRQLVVELVYGQSRDIIGTAAGRRDLAHARQVAKLKSGSYTVLRPLQLGAVAAEADDQAHAALSRYGVELGEAFALRDDLLGVWGDPVRTGKPAGDDLLTGKPTVILALANQFLRGPAKRLLDRVGTTGLSPDDVGTLQDALRTSGVQQAVEVRISDHVDAAIGALDHAGLAADGITGLTRMAHRIAWRDR